MRQGVQNYLNSKSVIGCILENGCEAILSSKPIVLSVWKGHFSVSCEFLSDEVETIFRETETRNQKLLKSKFGHRKLIRKLFCSSLELKNECSEPLKKTLLSFCEVLGDEVETTSWKCDAKRRKLFKLKSGYKKLLRKWFWSYSERKNECSERLKRTFFDFFFFFKIIEWKCWNHCLGKWAKVRESLNQNLAISSILENSFEATLSSKTNVLSVWKRHFSV